MIDDPEIPAQGRPSVAAILTALRQEIRRQGLRARVLAARLGVAEPTLWRWLRGEGLTLANLDRLCQMLGLELRDLVATQAEQERFFTLAQERVLAADRGLGLVFFAILNGAQRAALEADFGLPPARITHYLTRLQRLALIDIAPTGRLRPLVARAAQWRRGGPLAMAFERTIKAFFLSMDFGTAEARYVSDMVRLSAAGRARVQALFETLREDILLIAAQDASARHEQTDWSGLLMLIHPLNLNEITREFR